MNAQPWRRALAAALLGWVGAPAAAADVNVYVSYTKKGMPVFTDAPAADGRLVFTYRPPSAPGLSVVGPDAAAPARVSRAAAAPQDVIDLARQAARRHGLDAALLMALMDVESGFQRRARSPAGAMGLMQLMPQTARRFGADDPWDPHANVDAGARYLSYLLVLFEGDLKLALAGYNAGEGSVIAAGRRVPPFAETRRYVPAVLDRLRHWSVALQRAPRP